MKDFNPDHDLLTALNIWTVGEAQSLANILHRDFMAVGNEDGLYIHATKGVYLGFAADMMTESSTGSQIEWVDRRGRIAAACVTCTGPEARRTTILTLMRCDVGWRVMTATFSVEDQQHPKAARQPLLQ